MITSRALQPALVQGPKALIRTLIGHRHKAARGQRDKARVYKLEGGRIGETPVQSRPEKNEGHPGAMLSLSANGEKDGILWAAIHATGDSWHESRPGILHAYVGDDIGHELWNSLQVPTRDNCNNYSKMAPPTIANGRVYLSSFGTANVGTGQLCVYGLLASGPGPSAPEQVQAETHGRFVNVAWQGVPGAETYSVTRDGVMITSGLTRPAFTEAAAFKGTVAYAVIAVNANGPGSPSAPVKVTIGQAPVPRVMH